MAMTALDIFVNIVIFSFGLVTLLAGVFTAYFGAGKSRKIGIGLAVFGLFALFLWVGFAFLNIPALQNMFPRWNFVDIARAVVAVVASVVGAAIALGLFLVSIMKA
jgi:hypothetical protein